MVISAIIAILVVLVLAALVLAFTIGGGEFDLPGSTGTEVRIPTDPKNKLPVAYGERLIAGQITMADISDDRDTMYFIISLTEGPVEAIDQVTWIDKVLTFDGDISTGLRSVTDAVDTQSESFDFLNGNFRVKVYPEGGRCPEMETNSTRWGVDGANRTMPNVAYVYCELDYSREDQIISLPTKLYFNVKGKKVKTFNSSGVLSSTLNYSSNYAECAYDYLTNTRYGCKSPIIFVDSASFFDHSKFCDDMITSTDAEGTTITAKRFQCNGVISTTEDLDKNLWNLTFPSLAHFTYDLGKFKLATNNSSSVVKSYSEDNIYGNLSYSGAGYDSIVNELTIKYPDSNTYEKENQVILKSPESVKNVGEPVLSESYTFSTCNTNIEAHRVGAIILNNTRKDLAVQFFTDLSSMTLQVNDVIDITHTDPGWVSKQFRVESVMEVDREDVIGIAITAREYSVEDYNDLNITAYDSAPNSNFPDPFLIPSIGTVVVTSAGIISSGVPLSKLKVSWDGSATFLGRVVVRYFLGTSAPSNESDWIYAPESTGDSVLLEGLEPSSSYYIEYQVVSTLGRRTSFVAISGATSATADTTAVVSNRYSIPVFLFQRNSTIPTLDPTISAFFDFIDHKWYDAATGSTEVTSFGNGWLSEVPDGADALYSIRAVANSNSDRVSIATTEWNTIKLNAGGAVTLVDQYETIYAFKNAFSTPLTADIPTAQTYVNGVADISGNSWDETRTNPGGGSNRYVKTATMKQTLGAGSFTLDGSYSEAIIDLGGRSAMRFYRTGSSATTPIVGDAAFNTFALAEIATVVGTGAFPVLGDVFTLEFTNTSTDITTVLNGVHDGTGNAADDWETFAVELDGSLLVQGTVTSDSILTGAITADKVTVDGNINITSTTGSISGGFTDVTWDVSSSTTSNVLSDNGTATTDFGDGWLFANTTAGARAMLGSSSRYFKLGKDGLVLGGIVGSDVNATTTFRQNSQPLALMSGDVWYDTDDGNRLYVSTAAGNNWITTRDTTIATAQGTADTASSVAANAQGTAASAQTAATTASNAASNAQSDVNAVASQWSSSTSYTVGSIITYGTPTSYRIFKCILSRSATATVPTSDPTHWQNLDGIVDTANGLATTGSIRENSITTTDLVQVGDFTVPFTETSNGGGLARRGMLDVTGPLFSNLLGGDTKLIVRPTGVFVISLGNASFPIVKFDMVLYSAFSNGTLNAELDRVVLLNDTTISTSSSNNSGIVGYSIPTNAQALIATVPQGGFVRVRLELEMRPPLASATTQYSTSSFSGVGVNIEYLGGAR